MRPTDVFPRYLVDEMARVWRLDSEWMRFINLEDGTARITSTVSTWMTSCWKVGGEAWGSYAMSAWVGTGPKVFKPTPLQCRALENVTVNLGLADYAQPFPALLVVLDGCEPFTSAICHHGRGVLTVVLNTRPGGWQIMCTTASTFPGEEPGCLDAALIRFNDTVSQDEEGPARRSIRIALNACLALVNHGCHAEYLYPKEVESDRRLARERTERGERARHRLPLAVMAVSFDREVALHRTERAAREPGAAATGASMPCHWRRGHWAMQPCGPGRSGRKRVLRPPVLVRADLLVGDQADTTTTYRS